MLRSRSTSQLSKERPRSGWSRALQDQRHLQTKAAELARLIRRLQTDYPGRPIYILAKSGGTGLALRAAELLPERTLERIILLSAAVSPDYDLRPALRSTRREIVYRHEWQIGDLLMWDNCGVMHRALPYAADSGRLMHRTVLHGVERIAGVEAAS